MELELDENHIYRLDGVIIPGCTQVLAAMGATPGYTFLSPADLEFYRSRGHAVHKAIELELLGVLDRRTVVDEVKRYLAGWEKFAVDHKVEPLDYIGTPFVERPLHHRVFRFGVTPDIVARVDGRPTIIEIKSTSAHAPATGVQLAAQELAVQTIDAYKGEKFERCAVRLTPKTLGYDLRYYTNAQDRGIWLSLLSGYNWLRRNNLLKERGIA